MKTDQPYQANYFFIVSCLSIILGWMLQGCATVHRDREIFYLVDPNATHETRALYRNLLALSQNHVLFGHQDALAYGVGRRDNQQSFSDVKDVTSSYPAIYGWDIGHIAYDNNVDSVPFDLMIKYIREGYERGGVITISWHELSPRPHKPIWSREPKPALVIPGGEMHEEFRERLDMVGNFFNQLRDSKGRPIPVIFRPYHEHNGDWFWWCRHNSTEDEYIDLWRYTVHYLRDTLNINHLLYAISPDRSRMETAHRDEDFLYAYPGNDYVDIIGLDNYWDAGGSSNFNPDITREQQDSLFLLSLQTLVRIAEERGKIPALTETGYNRLTADDWFTSRILAPLREDSVARKIAWVLVWRNAWFSHFFAPYPGHPAADDFNRFRQDDIIIFEEDLPPMYQ